MTARPLLRHTVAQLEEMFAARPSDTGTLKALDTELQFRNVPRATALLENPPLQGSQGVCNATLGARALALQPDPETTS